MQMRPEPVDRELSAEGTREFTSIRTVYVGSTLG